MPNDLAKLKHLYDVLKACEEADYPFAEPDQISLLENLKYFNSLIDNALGVIPSDPDGLADIISHAERVILVIQNSHDFSLIDKRLKYSINFLKFISRHVFDLPVPKDDDDLFFFNVIENDKPEIRGVVYNQSGSDFFKNIFSTFDLTKKNIKLGDKVIMPDRKMDLLKEGDRYFLILFGRRFFELKPTRFINPYIINIVPIDDDYRCNEFIVPLADPQRDWMRLNIDCKNVEIEKTVFEGTAKDCIQYLKGFEQAKLFVLIRNSDHLNRVQVPFVIDTSDPESLKLIASKSDAPAEPLIAEGQPIQLENSMYIYIEFAVSGTSLYECLQAELTETGESQLEIIENHIRLLSKTFKENDSVYAPFAALIQSSGFGKTKLCIELLCSHPGLYMVFRDPGQTGVPSPTDWMDKFEKFVFGARYDELPFLKDDYMKCRACNYTPGRFLIALLYMINAYTERFELLKSVSDKMTDEEKILDAINQLGCQYFDPSLKLDSNAFTVSFLDDKYATIRDVIRRIGEAVAKISNLTASNYPFLFFIDEADVFSSRKADGRLPGINVIRRGLHLLDLTSDIMVIAIGTNSDALDFTPAVRDNSLRDLTRRDVLSAFIFTHNWDVLLSSLDDLESIEISDKLVLNKAFFNVLVAMGRPVWGSLELQQVVRIAAAKLGNGSPNSVAALVARLLVRANLSVNVHHILARTLVRSYMVIVNHISTDARTMKIGYSSEPVLAMAARRLLQGTELSLGPDEESKEAHAAREASFRALKKMVEHQAIDKGRLVEFIFEQLSLFAADDAQVDLEFLHEPESDEIPVPFQDICRKRSHVLQSFNDTVNESFSLPIISENDYRAMTVESYLTKYFGRDTHRGFSKMLPEHVLKGIVNVSHYVQLERTKSEDFEELNCRVSGSKTEPIIDRALLKCGVMRCCGFVMPPNYYGIDFIVPYIIKHSLQTETEFTRPVYSFIAFQSKTVKETVHDCAYKMAASAHLVRCPKHASESECKNEACVAYFTKAEMDIMSKGQVTVLLAAKNTTLKDLDPESTISMNGDLYKSLRQQIKAKKAMIDKMSKDKNRTMEREIELKKMDKEMNELIGKTFKLLGYSSRRHPDYKLDTFPKKRDPQKKASFPDKIITHRLNTNYTLQQMVWKKPNEKMKYLLCIAANDLKCFKHLVGENCLAVMKELVGMDSSNLNHVEKILRPVVQDSLLNGIFSPYCELNPVLRSMRGLPRVNVPKVNSFTPAEWKNTVKEAAKGPLEEEIKGSLSETYVQAIRESAENEIRELYYDEEDEKAMAD